MRERVAKEIGVQSESVWISTFHAFCVAILRRYGKFVGLDSDFSIYADNDSRSKSHGFTRARNGRGNTNPLEVIYRFLLFFI